MATTTKTTLVALGHSNSPDAFQAGREAAQMAKSQFPKESTDLVLAFAPANAHFQDFVEGVRLMTGENGLLGIPVHQALTNNSISPTGNLVLLVESETIFFSVASTEFNPALVTPAFTTLLSRHRQTRGDVGADFRHHGWFLIDNVDPADKKRLIQEASVETGMNSWVVSVTPSPSLSLPIIFNDIVHRRGLISVECLSKNPWGIGLVGLGAFVRNTSLYLEAMNSAYREALEVMTTPPAACLMLYDFPIEVAAATEIQAFVHRDDSPFASIPFLGLSTACHAVKYPDRSGSVQKETIVVLLLPS